MMVQISSGNGILVCGKAKLRCDPKRVSGLCFVSHAHSDHIPEKGNGQLLCSDETFSFLLDKGLAFERAAPATAAKLVPSGHIIGSSMLKIAENETVLYTGDLCTRNRLFLEGAKPEKCDTLILESTFGSENSEFPKLDEIKKATRDWAGEAGSAILFGYSIGKAQILTAMVGSLGYTPIVHNSVFRANEIAERFGYKIGNYVNYGSSEAAELMKGGHVIIAPPSLCRSGFTDGLKKKFGTRTAVYTGWAMDGRCRGMFGVDEAFPLSDHSSLPELLEFVKKCSPAKVYTVHGRCAALANRLKKLGFDAQPFMKKGQTTLS